MSKGVWKVVETKAKWQKWKNEDKESGREVGDL